MIIKRTEGDAKVAASLILTGLLFGALLGGCVGTHNGSDSGELQQDYYQLKEDYRRLKEDYRKLEENYQTLRIKSENAIYPPFVYTKNRSVHVGFKDMGGAVHNYYWSSEAVEYQTVRGTILRQFSYSQLRYLGWGEEFEIEGNSKYIYLEGQGYYYNYSPFVVPKNFEGVMANDTYNRYDSDRKRVKEVWNYVTQINIYNSELNETPRYPLETLMYRGGDCEDSAILAASMLKALSEDWKVQFVYMDADNPSDLNKVNHVALYVDTGEYSTFIETTSDRVMNPYQRVDGYYITVDPADS